MYTAIVCTAYSRARAFRSLFLFKKFEWREKTKYFKYKTEADTRLIDPPIKTFWIDHVERTAPRFTGLYVLGVVSYAWAWFRT